MLDHKLIYLHGSASDSNSGKARLFRESLPGMLTPDFTGSFTDRMTQLHTIVANTIDWTLIGSSYGGLMGTIFTLDHEAQVRKLILIHGTLDTVVPLAPVREIAEKLFTNLTCHIVEDDHRLHKTVHELDWNAILT